MLPLLVTVSRTKRVTSQKNRDRQHSQRSRVLLATGTKIELKIRVILKCSLSSSESFDP